MNVAVHNGKIDQKVFMRKVSGEGCMHNAGAKAAHNDT